MSDSRPRPRIVVTRRLPDAVERRLANRFDAVLSAADAPPSRDDLLRALRDADGVLCTVTDRLDAALLASPGVRARILANFGVGTNHVDLDAAREAGIVVTNTPDVLTDDTADLAILLMLTVARRAGEGERLVRRGAWEGWRPTHHLGTRLTGKTLGIVGFGRIGRATAERAHAGFGMRVLAWGPRLDEAALPAWAERASSLDRLLEDSDVVSLHCPATPDTRHLMNARTLRLMRRGAFLVNTARGDVVDEDALADALAAGALAGAGLDVHEREPVVHPRLLERENVVLLPHLGSATRETREAMGMRAVDNLEGHFSGRGAPDRVV